VRQDYEIRLSTTELVNTDLFLSVQLQHSSLLLVLTRSLIDLINDHWSSSRLLLRISIEHTAACFCRAIGRCGNEPPHSHRSVTE